MGGIVAFKNGDCKAYDGEGEGESQDYVEDMEGLAGAGPAGHDVDLFSLPLVTNGSVA